MASTDNRVFAFAIMKVTENLIYISEIVSSNFLFCQTFMCLTLSLPLFCLLPTGCIIQQTWLPDGFGFDVGAQYHGQGRADAPSPRVGNARKGEWAPHKH